MTDPRRPIAFIDSGVGGLQYLARFRELAPVERLLYVPDTANFPYGGKSADEIVSAVDSLVGWIRAIFDPKLFVIACNTMSLAALETVRDRHPVPFVGVVPAVKPAARSRDGARIGVLGTALTVSAQYLDKLIADHAASAVVFRLPAPDLARFVEKRFLHASEAERIEAIRPYCERVRELKIDVLVLACTHYLFLKDEFHRLLGPDVDIIDSMEGVARQALRVATQLSEEAPPAPKAERDAACVNQEEDNHDSFYVTSVVGPEDEALYRDFARRFLLSYEGLLPGQSERAAGRKDPS